MPTGRETRDVPFTEAARQLLSRARAESERRRHEYIGTEHVVLGLLRERMNLGAQVLQENGLTLEQAEAEVQRRGGAETA